MSLLNPYVPQTLGQRLDDLVTERWAELDARIESLLDEHAFLATLDRIAMRPSEIRRELLRPSLQEHARRLTGMSAFRTDADIIGYEESRARLHAELARFNQATYQRADSKWPEAFDWQGKP